MNNAVKTSYKKHAEHYKSKSNNLNKLLNTWTRKDTTDYWRHQKMYKNLQPFININKNLSWVTIGDGRFGKDANYIINNGVDKVLATDIDDTLLKIGKKNNFIKEYKKENAEKISFKDNAFDYVLCKESFHHFPRPYIALYEMIRVARKAVILIEPHDIPIYSSPIAILKQIFKPSKFSHINKYEEAGNFVYGIKKRELEKVALGLDLPAVSCRGIDDHYIKGVEKEVFSNKSPLARKITNKIRISKVLKKLKIRDSSMLVYAIFKKTPSNALIRSLKQANFRFVELPRNPYL